MVSLISMKFFIEKFNNFNWFLGNKFVHLITMNGGQTQRIGSWFDIQCWYWSFANPSNWTGGWWDLPRALTNIVYDGIYRAHRSPSTVYKDWVTQYAAAHTADKMFRPGYIKINALYINYILCTTTRATGICKFLLTLFFFLITFTAECKLYRTVLPIVLVLTRLLPYCVCS